MNFLAAAGVAFLFGFGFYLLLNPGLINRILGLFLISHGANFVLICMAQLEKGPLPPLLQKGADAVLANPLPQALILTALVIGFALGAFLWALALRLGKESA
ncbi:MAG: NADH-quinone oxidoreductase subunit K [Elusimicrobia bacterium]|nr:NADH-quinone oxidoreductase subunit K [Elusimicrobiota bacterium]